MRLIFMQDGGNLGVHDIAEVSYNEIDTGPPIFP